MISYYYEREKKSFNEHYTKHKLAASIGEDSEQDISSEEEIMDSEDEAEVEDRPVTQPSKGISERKIKVKHKSDIEGEEMDRRGSIASSNSKLPSF